MVDQPGHTPRVDAPVTGATVLIVDDDPIFSESLRMILPAHWQIFKAPDVKSALALASAEPVELALVDMHLLDGHGSDFIRMAGVLPCMLCTQDQGEPAFQAIFDDPVVAQNVVGYLTKPLRPGTIWSIRAGLQIGRERARRDRLVAEATARLEEERRQIAGQLHDMVGASLTHLTWIFSNIEHAAQSGSPGAMAEVAAQCRRGREVVRGAHGAVSRAVKELQPEEVHIIGLRGAVDYMLAQWQQTAPRVQFTLVCAKEVDQIDTRRAGIIYRIVQESITNAMRHTDAEAISLQMTCRDQRLEVALQSRGRVLKSTDTYLLTSLRERTASLGGVLQFSCEPQLHTSQLKVVVPI